MCYINDKKKKNNQRVSNLVMCIKSLYGLHDHLEDEEYKRYMNPIRDDTTRFIKVPHWPININKYIHEYILHIHAYIFHTRRDVHCIRLNNN